MVSLRSLLCFFVPQCLKFPHYRMWPSAKDQASIIDVEEWMEKLYFEQRAGFQASFKGKRWQIEQQYDKFWQQAPAKADADAYFNNILHHRYGLGLSNQAPATLKKWVQANTFFTTPKPNQILTENKHCTIIGNRESFDIAQYAVHPGTASMSFVHLLVLSKARLYNGVSLNRDNVKVIDEAIRLFKKSWRKPDFRQAVLDHQKRAIEQRYAANKPPSEADKEGYRAALRHYSELSSRIDKLREGDFQFGLHLWPDHSVSHLHIHIIAMTEEMRQYSTTEHDAKTKDALEVRDSVLDSKRL